MIAVDLFACLQYLLDLKSSFPDVSACEKHFEWPVVRDIDGLKARIAYTVTRIRIPLDILSDALEDLAS